MALTEKQTHALKFAELLGLGKLAKDVFKESIKQALKKVDDAKTGARYEMKTKAIPMS